MAYQDITTSLFGGGSFDSVARHRAMHQPQETSSATNERTLQSLMAMMAVMFSMMALLMRGFGSSNEQGDATQSKSPIQQLLEQLVEALRSGPDSQAGDNSNQTRGGGSDPMADGLKEIFDRLRQAGRRSAGNHANNERGGGRGIAGHQGGSEGRGSPHHEGSSGHPKQRSPSEGQSDSDKGHGDKTRPETSRGGGSTPSNGPGSTQGSNTLPSGSPGSPGGPQIRNGKPVAPTGTVVVEKTIVVKAGETFDGGGRLYKAGSSLGDGSQSEHQKPVFVLEPGAKIKNLQVQGADGIHCMGSADIDNCVWTDVGEDALTKKGYGNVTVRNSGAFGADDKIFQLNAGGDFTLENFYADGFGKVIRTNGNKQIDSHIIVRNSVFINGKESIVRTDSHSTFIDMIGNEIRNTPYEVLSPDPDHVHGARVGYKPYKG